MRSHELFTMVQNTFGKLMFEATSFAATAPAAFSDFAGPAFSATAPAAKAFGAEPDFEQQAVVLTPSFQIPPKKLHDVHT